MAGIHWNARNLSAANGLIPPGTIIMWSGSSVPSGWALCNGSNGTPDLRDRFIVGAGAGYSVGATGGTNSHSHNHTISGTTSAAPKWRVAYGWFHESMGAGGHTHSYSATASTVSMENRPPYYALAFIQKLAYTLPTDGVHFNESNLTVAQGLVPKGAIMLWSGSIDSIPSGWYLCNGSNGTPNLRDRFIVGAGNSYSIGATGGVDIDNHTHSFSGRTGKGGTVNVGVANYASGAHPDHTHPFSGSLSSPSRDNRPPYYALAFIMKG